MINVKGIFDWILAHWSFCAFALAVFVQITPVFKWNPITWLGNLLFGGLRKDIREVREQMDENEKDRIRWEVLDFANSCRNKRKHTKDEFEHVVALNKKYKALLKKTNDENGVFEAEYDYIMELYRKRLRKNDFLGMEDAEDDTEDDEEQSERR